MIEISTPFAPSLIPRCLIIDQAALTGSRLLEALATTDMDAGAATIRITATIGVTQMLPADQDFNDMMQRADAALYRGKEAGRNRVEINLT